MSKSIMQDKRSGECYLCNILLGIDTPASSREEHHVMHGTANRRLSEHYGLKVYICPYHHRTGPEAVHRCRQTNVLLIQAAQRVFERKYGHEKWMEVFGRNYLDTRNREFPQGAAGQELAAGDIREAAGGQPAATRKNQQNGPFSQFNISQNIPAGFCFVVQSEQDPGKEGQ